MNNDITKNKLEIFNEYIEHYIKSTRTIFKITCIIFISFVVTMSISIKFSFADITKINITQLMEQIMLFQQELIPVFGMRGKLLFCIFIVDLITTPLLYIHISKDFANLRANFKIAIINKVQINPTLNISQMFRFYRGFMMLNIYSIMFIILLSNAVYLKILDIDLVNILLGYSVAAIIMLVILIFFKSKEEEEALMNILKQPTDKSSQQPQ